MLKGELSLCVPGRRIEGGTLAAESGVIAELQTSALEMSVHPQASIALPLEEIPQFHIR
jgi:hypothetical protein